MMQLDLFAAPVAPPPMTALGAVEILYQGKATEGGCRWGQPGLWIRLRHLSGGVEMTSDYSAANCGGSGPSSYRELFADRTAALTFACRFFIKRCARAEAMADGWPDEAREGRAYLAMVLWLADMLPPMFSGFDAMAELDEMRARAKVKEAARREELRRLDDRRQAITAPIYAAEAYGYPNLIRLPGDGVWQWVGRWKDDGQIVTISRYSDEQEACPILAQLAAAIEANGVTVQLA